MGRDTTGSTGEASDVCAGDAMPAVGTAVGPGPDWGIAVGVLVTVVLIFPAGIFFCCAGEGSVGLGGGCVASVTLTAESRRQENETVCMSTSLKSDTFGNSNEIEQTSSCALEPPSAKE